MTDVKDENTAKDDAKKQKDQQIVDAYKRLSGTGFNKQQAAQQLSSKYAMTVDEVTAIIEQGSDDKQANKNDK
jgi:hypothetical protein